MAERLFKIYSSLRTYNKISVRDEATQQSNSDYIRAYVIIFCITNIMVGVVQVAIIHKMFFIDPTKIHV
ncbi:hypothetical protein OESDEN_05870 [Oesophagostomum dentatum]|uniref:Uncharacterized protein n=1 Tax=Oesophagostomum dentatum TaxID=61180 RepID=A0A0B1TEH2_OESDE|nr:hypothetical protein OESDEN_05870 [Oesophagostomum dentatum]